jgi:pimeloyl-ACP methyl ester carboxylesterase
MAQEMFVGVAGGSSLHVLAWSASDSAAQPRADAAPFLLLHGLASTARSWEPVAQRLAAAGHRVFAADLRGHGLSDKPDDGYDLATFASDLASLIEALELDGPVLVGHSLGAFVILEAFARHPELGSLVRGIVLVEGGLVEASTQFATLDECLARLAMPPVTGTPAPRLEGYFRHTYPEWSDERMAGIMAGLEVRADGTVEWWLTPARLQALARSMWEQDAAALCSGLTAPALWIVADTGDVTWTQAKQAAAEGVARSLPRSRVEWLVADHDVHAHRPDAVAALILDSADGGYFPG